MRHPHLLPFLSGAITAACLVASLFFVRFWRHTAERLFALFAIAFGILGLHWALLGFLPLQDEHRPMVYLLRLFAFGMILAGVIDKNRRDK
jgi:hypothetical protein